MADAKETQIIVQECRQVHEGTGRNGKPYKIYEVTATRPDRTPLEGMKLRAFHELPLGEPITVGVEKHVSEQYGESFTISLKGPKREGGISQGAFADALSRIAVLEDKVRAMAAAVYDGAQPTPTPSSAAPEEGMIF